MKYSCRTQTLCLKEGPPWWPPSSGECSLLIPLPEPARDPPAWERPRWKAAAERRDNLLQWAWPIETHLAVVSMLPNSLLREPVSQDWPLVYLELQARCPEVPTCFYAWSLRHPHMTSCPSFVLITHMIQSLVSQKILGIQGVPLAFDAAWVPRWDLHRSSTVYKQKQSKTALNKYVGVILTDGLEWCGLLWCYYQLFGLSLNTCHVSECAWSCMVLQKI